MMGRDRQLLAQMGIDLWIPRQLHVYSQPNRVLWRDQAIPETVIPAIPANHITTPKLNVQQLVNKAPDQHATVQAENLPADLQKELVSTQPHSTTVDQVQVKSARTASVVETPAKLQKIQHFTWQCLCYQHVVILVDAAELNADTVVLWENIQKFTQTQAQMLMWPLPWEQLQDLRGLASYIEGFVDSLSTQPISLICLGEGIAFEHLVQQHQADILPSLQDMMETPSLKKRLWEAMRRT